MAAVNNADIPEEIRMMKAFFDFRKQFYIPEDNQGYWEQMISASNELLRQYAGDRYFKELLFACIGDLERRAGNE